ncbi:MAG: DUF115 domain-containing protein [Sulfurimonas sp.]|nr:DUF115 domain-containing protein [Sulfurimonas sp.]
MYISEEILQNNYLRNLKYFEINHKNVYSKITALESAISQNLYQNRYDLVYKDTYFDIIELHSSNFLYQSSSIEYAKTVSNSINYKKDSNLFKTYKEFEINKNKLHEYENHGIVEHHINGIAPILNYINSNSISMPMNKIHKFIFFGVGIGNHITEVANKINSDIYFIVEDDLELFKLSMFITPYYKLAKKSTLLFSVFDSKDEFNNISEIFLNLEFYHNHYLKYFIMLNHSEEKLKEFHIKIISLSHNLFYYNSILGQYLQPLYYLKNNFNFLNILKSQINDNLGNKPVLFLSAGPSLKKDIKWVKENQNKFLIVALSAVLSILEDENIIPDIVTHLDGFEIAQIHFKKLKSLKFLKNTTFLISARTNTNITNKLNKKNIFFFENGTNYKKELGNLSAPCVGSTTFLLLLALGVQNMYLLGLDLALDSQTGKSHSDGHELQEEVDLQKVDEHEDNMAFRNTAIKAEGNFKNTVFTTPDFSLSAESINATTVGFKQKSQNIYNLGDGILFKNTLPIKIKEINLKSLQNIDKNKLKINLLNTFTLNSTDSMQDDELRLIKKYCKYCKKIKRIIEIQQDIAFNNEKTFNSLLINTYSKLTYKLNEQVPDLALVYQEFFKLIYPFIFDFFNIKNLNDKEKHMNEVNKILCKQLLKIVQSYEDGLKKFI